MKETKTIAVVIFLAVLAHPVVADELHVPSGYVAIQSAIDDANDGDVVIVADGTYTGSGNKNLDFGGRAITVRSAAGPEVTIIDCEDSGRAFNFHSGEGLDSIVDGFTVTQGQGDDGGAIYCENSSPAVMNCIFIDNYAVKNGGAIRLLYSSSRVTNCTFRLNRASEHGGAITCSAGDAVVEGCVFMDNSTSGFSADGAGMFISGDPAATVVNCLFARNQTYRDGEGGGIRTFYSSPVITNCTFVNNYGEGGGGIANKPDCSPTISNCVFWNNSSGYYGGHEIRNNDGSRAEISYCNIMGGWNGSRVRNTNSSSVVNGGGNINSDPLFVTGPLGDHYLSQIEAGQVSNSPCVDTGSDLSVNLGLDDWTTRTDELGDAEVVDMGYHYPSEQAYVTVLVDVKPNSCPNPLNLSSRGVLPVAVLGAADFDVAQIDAASVRLAGVAPIRSGMEDVASPVVDGNECACSTDGPDGFTDLTLKFATEQIVEQLLAMEGELEKGEIWELKLTGNLVDQTLIEGVDCVKLVGNVSKALAARKSDVNEDGIVNLGDFALLTRHWLEPTY